MIQNLRLTVQATPRNKFGFFWDEQLPCNGATWSSEEDGCRNQPTSGFIYGGTATIAPEAGGTLAGGSSGGYGHKFQRVQQVTWSSPMTSRLLLEAGFGTVLEPVWLQRTARQSDPGHRARHRTVHCRMLTQRRNSWLGLSITGLGVQLDRRAHVACVRVIRDRCAQHEVRLSGRIPCLRPNGVHE